MTKPWSRMSRPQGVCRERERDGGGVLDGIIQMIDDKASFWSFALKSFLWVLSDKTVCLFIQACETIQQSYH